MRCRSMNFEKDLARLEAIVAELENKSLSIDESLALFNEAVTAAKSCIEGINAGKGKLMLLTQELKKINLEVELEN